MIASRLWFLSVGMQSGNSNKSFACPEARNFALIIINVVVFTNLIASFSLTYESAYFQVILLSENKTTSFFFFFSLTLLVQRRPSFWSIQISCHNVHIKLAILRPQAPSQRAANLFQEGAPMTEVCYRLNRIVRKFASRTNYSIQTSGSLAHHSFSTEHSNPYSHVDPDSLPRSASSSVCCPALANNMATPSEPTRDPTPSSLPYP